MSMITNHVVYNNYVDEVYVVSNRPNELDDQSCHHDIVQEYISDYNCCVPTHDHKLYYDPSVHEISFNILGTRPINLSLDVVWSNHYPVDLHLSWTNEIANNNNIYHVSYPI